MSLRSRGSSLLETPGPPTVDTFKHFHPNIFVSHLPCVLINLGVNPSDNPGPSDGPAAGAGVGTATGSGGGWRWCGGRHR